MQGGCARIGPPAVPSVVRAWFPHALRCAVFAAGPFPMSLLKKWLPDTPGVAWSGRKIFRPDRCLQSRRAKNPRDRQSHGRLFGLALLRRDSPPRLPVRRFGGHALRITEPLAMPAFSTRFWDDRAPCSARGFPDDQRFSSAARNRAAKFASCSGSPGFRACSRNGSPSARGIRCMW